MPRSEFADLVASIKSEGWLQDIVTQEDTILDGRVRFLATIESRAVLRRILDHLGVPGTGSEPRPAQRQSRGHPDLFG